MRGMEQLRSARKRQAQLEASVVSAAREAARRVAVTLAQDLEFDAITPRFSDTTYAVTRGPGGVWMLVIVCEEGFTPSDDWEYSDCRRFGVHVKDGLVEAMAEILCDRLDEEERSLGDLAPPTDEMNTQQADDLEGIDDESVLSALQVSCDEIPVMLARSQSS